jgi:lysophospholipase L1-like esterase
MALSTSPLRGLVAWLGAAAAACAHGIHATPAPPGVERVVFVGDSLVNRSDRDHGLLDQVQRALAGSHPGTALHLVNAGVNGDCIADIRARLPEDVLALRPAAVVLYWDSDATDVEDAKESPAGARALRAAYEQNLSAVLATLSDTAPHVLVAGPTLLGERPHGLNPKDAVLDAYAEINRRLSHAYHVTWIDTRRAAFHRLRANPPDRRRDSGQLTEDGEHLNAEGTKLVAAEMASVMSRWLSGRAETPASPVQPPAAPLEPPPP